MNEGVTALFGLPIPSTERVFLGTVLVHIAFGLVAGVAGIVAMLRAKGSRRHRRAGTLYFWSLSGLTVTMSVLSYLRWREDRHLFVLGALAFAAGFLGRYAIRGRRPRLHLGLMATSYIVMLTAFYVDNGANLPLWRNLPHTTYWIVPAAIGLPIAIFYLFYLPRFSYSEDSVDETATHP